MRLRATKSAHSVSYSVIKSAYINKKRTTVTVEKLGNEKEICKKHGVSDALAWAKEYVANLNKNAEMNKEIEDGYNIVKLDGKFLIVKDSNVDQAVELAGVTDAHVIPTNDQDRNQNYNVLVVKKDGEWRVVDETKKGEDVLVLTGETITADTKFRLKDKTLYIE